MLADEWFTVCGTRLGKDITITAAFRGRVTDVTLALTGTKAKTWYGHVKARDAASAMKAVANLDFREKVPCWPPATDRCACGKPFGTLRLSNPRGGPYCSVTCEREHGPVKEAG